MLHVVHQLCLNRLPQQPLQGGRPSSLALVVGSAHLPGGCLGRGWGWGLGLRWRAKAHGAFLGVKEARYGAGPAGNLEPTQTRSAMGNADSLIQLATLSTRMWPLRLACFPANGP